MRQNKGCTNLAQPLIEIYEPLSVQIRITES